MTAIGPIVYPVKDATAAKKLFTSILGTEPYADEPYYVGFRVGDFEIGLDPNGFASGMTGSICYFPVEDIESSLQQLIDAGATLKKEVTDVGYGKLIATIEDADGNVIGLTQNPAGADS